MSEMAGFGGGLPWLPPGVARRQADEEARERAAANVRTGSVRTGLSVRLSGLRRRTGRRRRAAGSM